MSLMQRIDGAGGATLDPEGLERLRRLLVVPSSLATLMTTAPLLGLRFSLSEKADKSGLGVEMQWMDAEQMRREATEAYPGIVATKLGYFPIGTCLEGTGDPYFYRQSDGAVVRIPHEAATESGLDEGLVETVAESVEQFVAASAVEAP